MQESDPLVVLLDEARAGGAGAARTRQRWLERQAAEGATLVGTLLDLVEGSVPVSVRTTTGRTCQGSVVAVGQDFVVVRAAGGRDHCVRLGAVAAVRTQAGMRRMPATGRRPSALDLRLVEVLAGLVPERPWLGLVTAGGELVTGELVAMGLDVVTLAPEDERRGTLYVAVAAVMEAVLESG